MKHISLVHITADPLGEMWRMKWTPNVADASEPFAGARGPVNQIMSLSGSLLRILFAAVAKRLGHMNICGVGQLVRPQWHDEKRYHFLAAHCKRLLFVNCVIQRVENRLVIPKFLNARDHQPAHDVSQFFVKIKLMEKIDGDCCMCSIGPWSQQLGICVVSDFAHLFDYERLALSMVEWANAHEGSTRQKIAASSVWHLSSLDQNVPHDFR